MKVFGSTGLGLISLFLGQLSSSVAAPQADLRALHLRISDPVQELEELGDQLLNTFDRRTTSTYGITGIQTGKGSDGSVPYRLEIRQLQQNADQWNLYLLALDSLQTQPAQTEMLSHYQIAGIHGRPYISWDGVQATAGDQNSGYCTHSSILFPTWHRPYLALYEVSTGR